VIQLLNLRLERARFFEPVHLWRSGSVLPSHGRGNTTNTSLEGLGRAGGKGGIALPGDGLLSLAIKVLLQLFTVFLQYGQVP
jgi:hypothetical protein